MLILTPVILVGGHRVLRIQARLGGHSWKQRLVRTSDFTPVTRNRNQTKRACFPGGHRAAINKGMTLSSGGSVASRSLQCVGCFRTPNPVYPYVSPLPNEGRKLAKVGCPCLSLCPHIPGPRVFSPLPRAPQIYGRGTLM